MASGYANTRQINVQTNASFKENSSARKKIGCVIVNTLDTVKEPLEVVNA